jgi:hypothetical protein
LRPAHSALAPGEIALRKDAFRITADFADACLKISSI